MENILKLVKHNIKMFFKEPWGIVLLLLPIIMSVGMIKMLSVDIMSVQGTVGIYATGRNQELVEKLSERLGEENIAISLYFDQDKIVKEESIDGFDLSIEIEDTDLLEAMANNQKAMVITYKEGSANSELVRGTLESVLKEMQLLAKVSAGNQEEFNRLYKELNEKTKDIIVKEDGMTYMANKQAFGIFVMLLLMSGGYSLRTMAREKELKVYERIGRGPVRRYEYMLGHVGGSLILLGIQIVLEWIVLKSLSISFNLSIGIFLGIGLTLVLVSVGLGLLLLSLSSNANIFGLLLGFVIPPMTMLSDCLFPIELLPGWIDKISLLSPVRWVMEGYNTALMNGGEWSVLGSLVLANILAIILILLSIILESKKNKI